MKILVLGGGDSPEHQVSLQSAKSITNAARSAGFKVTEADPKEGLEVLDHLTDTIVFPILHGKNGEDGSIQKELENRNLAYLGSDSTSSANCFDKWTTRLILEEAGLPVAAGVLVTKDDYPLQDLAKNPHVLKVLHGGSSIGTLIVKDPLNVKQDQINDIFRMEDKAVLEKLIDGIEITIPIFDKQALPAIEIVPPVNEEFDYENKYNGRTQEICPPKSVNGTTQKESQELAVKVHEVMGCRHLSRVDIMLDKDGQPFVLEINTIPGMTDQSLYPKAAKVAGLGMPDLIKHFVDLVKRDFKVE